MDEFKCAVFDHRRLFFTLTLTFSAIIFRISKQAAISPGVIVDKMAQRPFKKKLTDFIQLNLNRALHNYVIIQIRENK